MKENEKDLPGIETIEETEINIGIEAIKGRLLGIKATRKERVGGPEVDLGVDPEIAIGLKIGEVFKLGMNRNSIVGVQLTRQIAIEHRNSGKIGTMEVGMIVKHHQLIIILGRRAT